MKLNSLLPSGWRGTSQTPLTELDIALAHLLQNLQGQMNQQDIEADQAELQQKVSDMGLRLVEEQPAIA